MRRGGLGGGGRKECEVLLSIDARLSVDSGKRQEEETSMKQVSRQPNLKAESTPYQTFRFPLSSFSSLIASQSEDLGVF